MKKIQLAALTLLLISIGTTLSCTETCKICDPLIDADSVADDYTSGSDGCVTFDASDCDNYMVVDAKGPAMEMSML